jgi:hypothetical protein
MGDSMSDSGASGAAGNTGEGQPRRLRDALRQARIEAADRTGVVVDLRDAEVARLEILSDALDPLFAEIPDTIDLFDRGITRGDPPRLWVDVVAHIVMGRDKRTYRFVQDTRHGRIVLAESNEVPPIVEAVTDYVARRIVEREHALAVTVEVGAAALPPRQRSRLWPFLIGAVVGAAALFTAAMIASLRSL